MDKPEESSSTPQETGKTRVEICLISGRGLPRSSLWKLHWFAVGWVDPADKYLTRIDASGGANPVWRTKFGALADAAAQVCVEVYSRDPVFLREKLHGVATASLREFVAEKGVEQVASFQLRKKGSMKPNGFVDISVRAEPTREPSSSAPDYGGFQLADNHLAMQAGPPQVPFSRPPSHPPPPASHPYAHPTPYPSNYANPTHVGPNYPPALPPPPPTHSGYMAPNYSYMSLPPSGGAAGGYRGGAPGFAAGVGAGAVVGGALMFGGDMISGFDLPKGFGDPSLTVVTDPPF